MIVEIELDDVKVYKSITQEEVAKVRKLPFSNRYDFLVRLPDAVIANSQDVDYYVDATGN